MSSPMKNIVLAGATGSIGRPILASLQRSNAFNLTLLTRPSGDPPASLPPTTKTHQTDYTLSSLLPIFQHQDALIIALPPEAPASIHQTLITAAVQAGVRLIVPSEFGSDISNPHVHAFPVFTAKRALQAFLEDATRGTGTAWSAVRCGPFLDFCFDIGLFMDVQNRRMRLYDGGDVVFTTTLTATVGDAVVGLLNGWEAFRGRVAWVQGARVSQRQLLAYAQEATGREGWTVEEVDTDDVERSAWKAFEEDPGDVYGWLVPFLTTTVWRKGYGGDFEKNDDQALGIKMMSDEEVRGWIQQKISGPQ